MRWPRLTLPPAGRVRIISVIGSAVLVVLVATAVAVWLNAGPPHRPPGVSGEWDPYGLQSGAQAGASPTPATRPSSAFSPAPTSTAQVIVSGSPAVTSASYRTIALLGLGGFDTEVTVKNPGRASWRVVLTMPEDKVVENRSTNLVTMDQQGTSVTLTPANAATETVTFTIRFPALLALGKSVTGCTIDGRACSAP